MKMSKIVIWSITALAIVLWSIAILWVINIINRLVL